MKYIIYIILIFTFSCKDNDKSISNKQNESLVNNFLFKSKDKNNSKENRIKFNDSALFYISKENSKKNRLFLSEISEEYYNLYQTDKQGLTASDLLKLSIKAKDSILIGKSYNLLAKYKFDYNDVDSTYFYFLKAEKTFIKYNDSVNLCKNYIDKSDFFYKINNYFESQESAINALKFFNNDSSKKNEYLGNNIVGLSLYELKSYENSLKYLKKALVIVNKNNEKGNDFEKAILYNNIGLVYQKMNRHNDALNYFKEALKLEKTNPRSQATISDNLAYSKFKLKDFSQLPELYYNVIKIREEKKVDQSNISTKIHLSEYYSYFKDTINAQKFAKEALQMAKTTRVSGDILISLKQLSVVDSKNTSYNSEYIQISDSLQLAERQTRDRFARIAFETDEVIAEKTIVESQNKTLLYYLLATILLASMVIVIRNQRAKNIALAYKEEQQKTNQTIYNLMISQEEKAE